MHKPAKNQQLYLLEITAENWIRKLAQIIVKPRNFIKKTELKNLEKTEILVVKNERFGAENDI